MKREVKKYRMLLLAFAVCLTVIGCKNIDEDNIPVLADISDIPLASDYQDSENDNPHNNEENSDNTDLTDDNEPNIDSENNIQIDNEKNISNLYNNSNNEAESSLNANDNNESKIVESISLTVYSVELNIGKTFMPIVTMLPKDANDKSEIWVSSDEYIAVVDGKGNITAVDVGECVVTVTSVSNPKVSAEVKVVVSESIHSDEASQSGSADVQITYIDGILIVNKTYALPSDYAPGFSDTVKSAFEEMQMAALDEGFNLYIASGYRSYDYQDQLYNRYVANSGKDEADRFSARAGHSEHQTGLALDLNSIDDSFKDTAEGKWVAENCYKYGFIIRYPEGKESITGYKYEPWHLRYLGKETAAAVFESGLTLEEYLGITSAYAE